MHFTSLTLFYLSFACLLLAVTLIGLLATLAAYPPTFLDSATFAKLDAVLAKVMVCLLLTAMIAAIVCIVTAFLLVLTGGDINAL